MALQVGEVYAVVGVDLSKAQKGLEQLLDLSVKMAGVMENVFGKTLGNFDANAKKSCDKIKGYFDEIPAGLNKSMTQAHQNSLRTFNAIAQGGDAMATRIENSLKKVAETSKSQFKIVEQSAKASMQNVQLVKPDMRMISPNSLIYPQGGGAGTAGMAKDLSALKGMATDANKFYNDATYKLEYTSRHLYLGVIQPVLRFGKELVKMGTDYETTMLRFQGITGSTE
jgi:hypothetical protein